MGLTVGLVGFAVGVAVGDRVGDRVHLGYLRSDPEDPTNMSVLDACEVFQHSRWSNALASLNIRSMSFTAVVFQLPIAWLNALAKVNMASMLVTLAVSQLPSGWLNA